VTKYIVDYEQYRLDINKANQSPDPAKWDLVYKATELFGVTTMRDIDKITQALGNMDKDEEFFKRILGNYFSGGSLIDEYLKKSGKNNYI
jgi:hypothetical protein